MLGPHVWTIGALSLLPNAPNLPTFISGRELMWASCGWETGTSLPLLWVGWIHLTGEFVLPSPHFPCTNSQTHCFVNYKKLETNNTSKQSLVYCRCAGKIVYRDWRNHQTENDCFCQFPSQKSDAFNNHIVQIFLRNEILSNPRYTDTSKENKMVFHSYWTSPRQALKFHWSVITSEMIILD